MTLVRCSNSYKIPTFPRSLYSYPDYVLEIKKGNSDSRQISPKVSAVMLIFKSENMSYLKKLVWNLIHYRIGKKLKLIWLLYLPKIMYSLSPPSCQMVSPGKGVWSLHFYLIPISHSPLWVITHSPIKACITPLN